MTAGAGAGAQGRVRAVSGRARAVLEHGWESARVPAGAIAEPHELAAAGASWEPAAVPGPIAAPGEDGWWRLRSGTPIAGRLGFDGIASAWDAWLDGEWVAHGDSMHDMRAIDVAVPAHELVVRCRAGGRRPPPVSALIGPWRAIWLQPPGAPDVGVVRVDARLEAGVGFVSVGAQLPAGTTRAELVVSRGGDRVHVALDDHGGAWTGCVAIGDPARWWPHALGEPARYDVAIELSGGAIELGATGFRALAASERGELRIDGRPIALHGALWAPLDPVALAAPAAAYDDAVRRLAAAGVTIVRVPGTTCYEADALYDALDAHGILLWQDLMFPTGDCADGEVATAQAIAEAEQQLARLAARPSLAVVAGCVAPAGSPRALFDELLPARVRALVPGTHYVASAASWAALTGAPR